MMGDTPPLPGNEKYKPLPKRKDGNRRVVDTQKIYDAYIAGEQLVFRKWMREQGYNPRLANKFPVQRWQREYAQAKLQEQNEEFFTQALKLRATTLQKRITLQEQNLKSTEALRYAVNELLRMHVDNVNHDRQHQAEIFRGERQRRFKADASELSQLSTTLATLSKIERDWLMHGKAKDPMLADQLQGRIGQGTDLVDVQKGNEPDQAQPAIPLLGANTALPREKIVEILGAWYDDPGQSQDIVEDPQGPATAVTLEQHDQAVIDTQQDHWEDG